jgi:hypothetical protein
MTTTITAGQQVRHIHTGETGTVDRLAHGAPVVDFGGEHDLIAPPVPAAYLEPAEIRQSPITWGDTSTDHLTLVYQRGGTSTSYEIAAGFEMYDKQGIWRTILGAATDHNTDKPTLIVTHAGGQTTMRPEAFDGLRTAWTAPRTA